MYSLPQNNFFVIIPAYNESNNIIDVIQGVWRYTKNIIVVDDGSSDDTYLKVKNNFGKKIIVLKHKINLGKGAALKTGCEAALRLGAKVIITMDGDGQHHPEDIPKLINKLRKENLDIVFGLRQFEQKTPPVKLLGNKILSFLTKLFTKINLSDTQSGMRAFTREAYKKIRWQSTDYSAETEMIVKAANYRLKYGTVPITTIYKDSHKGTTPIDGLFIFFNLLKWKFL